MNAIVVRAADEEDVSLVVEIERQCEPAPHWGAEAYRQIVLGTSTLKRCLLVTDGGSAMGGFAVGRVAAGVGELESVAVLPACRRVGAGLALCRGVMAWCREQGADAVELEVRAQSEGARKLYQQIGFKEVGRRAGYYSNPVDDAVLMLFEYANHVDGEDLLVDGGRQ